MTGPPFVLIAYHPKTADSVESFRVFGHLGSCEVWDYLGSNWISDACSTPHGLETTLKEAIAKVSGGNLDGGA